MPSEPHFQASTSADFSDDNPFASAPSAGQAPTPDGQEGPASPSRDEKGRFVKAEKPKHSAYWLRRAADVGIHDDADELSPAELQSEVHHRELMRARYPHDGELPQRAQAQAPAEEPERPELNADQFDPALVAELKALRQEVKELKAGHGTIKKNIEARAATEREDIFDAAFESLGKQYEKFFGKGPAADLRGKPELKRRADFLRMVGIDPNQPLPPHATAKAIARALKSSAESIYGPVVNDAYAEAGEEPPAKPGPTPEQQRWIEGATEKPTHRTKPGLPPGLDRAKQTFQDGIRQLEGSRSAAETPTNGIW